MPEDVIPHRYQPTYRADETGLILDFASRGESLGFVGIAGVGKSNIVNYLRYVQHNPQRIGQVEHLHFPIVDATKWEGTVSSLWKEMLDGLAQVTKTLTPIPEQNKVIPFSKEAEEERLWDTLRAHLQLVCQDLNHKVMLVLDDFDDVLRTGPLTMLERLNALRSEGNREHLSYLILTKRLPHVLGRGYDIAHRSKFYDLFRYNIYALAPYTSKDARQMLDHLNAVGGKPLNSRDKVQILNLAGGHAQLLKVLFNTYINEGAPAIDPVIYFAGKSDIHQECQRILINLHMDEQQAALRLARGQHTPKDQAAIDHLARRGLLVKLNPPTWFSPLMAQFLTTYVG
jgi:hypothetical protein